MLGAIQSFGLFLIGYSLIFSGIAFINKLLFPELLEAVYQNTGFIARAFIMSMVFGFVANLFISPAFTITSISIAGPLMLAAILMISIINAMILNNIELNLPIIGATLGALFFCCLTAWLLESQRIGG